MNTKKIAYSGTLIAFGIILPSLFHFLMPTLGLGPKLLPIHYGAYFAGGFFGPVIGGIVGFFTTILTFIITGMPPQITITYIAFETMTYGIVFGFLYHKKKINVYVSMLISMTIGRLVYFVGLYVFGNLLFNQLATAFQIQGILTALSIGILGTILQFAIIPTVIRRVNKVFQFNEDSHELR